MLERKREAMLDDDDRRVPDLFKQRLQRRIEIQICVEIGDGRFRQCFPGIGIKFPKGMVEIEKKMFVPDPMENLSLYLI